MLSFVKKLLRTLEEPIYELASAALIRSPPSPPLSRWRRSVVGTGPSESPLTCVGDRQMAFARERVISRAGRTRERVTGRRERNSLRRFFILYWPT
jgi:hypothetical protein